VHDTQGLTPKVWTPTAQSGWSGSLLPARGRSIKIPQSGRHSTSVTTVQDARAGVAERVFEPSSRLDSSRSTDRGGGSSSGKYRSSRPSPRSTAPSRWSRHPAVGRHSCSRRLLRRRLGGRDGRTWEDEDRAAAVGVTLAMLVAAPVPTGTRPRMPAHRSAGGRPLITPSGVMVRAQPRHRFSLPSRAVPPRGRAYRTRSRRPHDRLVPADRGRPLGPAVPLVGGRQPRVRAGFIGPGIGQGIQLG
jgi:hypothetical protein